MVAIFVGRGCCSYRALHVTRVSLALRLFVLSLRIYSIFMFAVQQAALFLFVGLVYPNGSMTDSAVDGCIHLANRSGGSVASGSICSGSEEAFAPQLDSLFCLGFGMSAAGRKIRFGLSAPLRLWVALEHDRCISWVFYSYC